MLAATLASIHNIYFIKTFVQDIVNQYWMITLKQYKTEFFMRYYK